MESFQLIRPYFILNKKRIALGLLCLVLVDLFQLIIPRIIKRAVDDITYLRSSTKTLLIYFSMMVILAFFMMLFRYGWRRLLIGMSREIETDMRNRLFTHVQTLSAAFFDKTRTGDIMAHATNDLSHVRMAAGMGMVAFADAVFMGIASIVFMLYISIPLTVTALIPMPFIALFTKIVTRKMHSRYQDVQAGFSDLTENVRERFSGIRIIKSYRMEAEAVKQMEAVSNEYVDKNIRLTKVTGLFMPMMNFFTNISLTAVLFLGGRETVFQNVTTGDFVAFINYLGLLAWPMMALGWVGNLIQRGKASLDRIHNILSVTSEVKSPVFPVILERIDNDIDFTDVSFTYPYIAHSPNDEEKTKHAQSAYSGMQPLKSRPPALNNISIHIAKGSMTGIAGPPGSGKSTFLKLIPRLYDVSSGRINLDGCDIRNLDLNTLRSLISLVPQEPFIFDGTIRENIMMGNPVAGNGALENALRDAALESTILEFPKGLDTVVGERGIVLSGGQKQRIALARAFLSERPVWLLDDPISQVDTGTATRIIEGLISRKGERTIIIVSHRISAIRHSENIFILNKGEIVETGSHEALTARGGYYADQFDLQRMEEDTHAV